MQTYKAPLSERLYFIVVHKWKYLWAIFLSNFYTKDNTNIVRKVIYLARVKDKDWIFGAKVRRLSKHSSLEATTHFNDKFKNIPDADGYYHIYQNHFCRAIRRKPNILNKRNVVMFTHPSWSRKYSITHVIFCLNKADYIICLNSFMRDDLISLGVKPEKLVVMHIATSDTFFKTHERGTGGVGFCSNYGPRKNPDLLYDIVMNMPHRKFHLVGRNWDNYEKFSQLLAQENFTYYDNLDYEMYPKLYSKMDVFVSPSILEGGPVPILEAMMSNCVPVASKTGFCPDIINHGQNGFLFDINSDYKEVIGLIDKAFDFKINTRDTVIDFTWSNCSKRIDGFLTGKE